MSKQSHIERTAHEPRDTSLHTLTIAHITQVSPTIRLFRLAIPPDDSITFLPGQWVDLHPPPAAQVPKPGGFTITSSPSLALPNHTHKHNPTHLEQQEEETPYIELAIQSSPSNPAAAYLFLPAPQLLHTPVQVRIGGSFVFPPPPFLRSTTNTGVDGDAAPPLRKVVLVAGGMGVNPLVSMLSWIGEQQQQAQGGLFEGVEVRMLYSVRDYEGAAAVDGGAGTGPEMEGGGGGGGILFLERIAGLFDSGRVKGGLRLFLTRGGSVGGDGVGEASGGVVRCAGGVGVPFLRRRMTIGDVEEAVGEDKEAAVVYVCGVPGMTDEFVELLVLPEGFGMDPRRVLFEKWW
ncbi:oxidoreductase NAD-binding domain-containing protein 1 [Parachaetomium inaequale]|uniref:Oxidoreductase NAD-binding domain-containing protein 1 n=1 Tax=Parachaetomium inaequale TaxID=2588326 RepID=A0AAN6SSN8_9PEZI|nr:oxidoreductase NAD-binding domain-containing protein 1 [Parachaetomium inaequale]